MGGACSSANGEASPTPTPTGGGAGGGASPTGSVPFASLEDSPALSGRNLSGAMDDAAAEPPLCSVSSRLSHYRASPVPPSPVPPSPELPAPEPPALAPTAKEAAAAGAAAPPAPEAKTAAAVAAAAPPAPAPPPAPPPPRPLERERGDGDKLNPAPLNEVYEIGKVLGAGAFSTVRRVTHRVRPLSRRCCRRRGGLRNAHSAHAARLCCPSLCSSRAPESGQRQGVRLQDPEPAAGGRAAGGGAVHAPRHRARN